MEGEDVSGLFEPERNSVALVFLRRLVGCTFEYIWTPAGGGGGSCSGNGDVYDIIATLIEVFNWAMLAVIAAVATYLFFAALKDTANDGQMGGRSMNPSWTLVMAAIGAILCFPAFNGFSALQMGTMQVAVWSTGLGDNMWRKAAEKMANANAVDRTFNMVFTSEGEDAWMPWNDEEGSEGDLRTKIARGLQQRVAGELCKDGIVAGAQAMATTGDTTIRSATVSTPATADNARASEMLLYRAGGAFAQSVGLCGSVTVSYVNASPIEDRGGGDASLIPVSSDSEKQIASELRNYSNAASSAVARAIINGIDQRSSALKARLFPASGQRLLGDEQVTAINEAVQGIAQEAKQAGMAALEPALPAIKSLTQQAMARNTENGWMYAVLYQRLLASSTMGLTNLGNSGISVSWTQPTTDLAKAFNCGWILNACAEQLDVFFRQYKNDIDTIDKLEGAFVAASQGTNSAGTNDQTQRDVAGATGWIARKIAGLLNGMLGVNSVGGDGWVDPIPQMQQSGGQIMAIGGTIAAVGAGGSVATSIPGPWAIIGSIVEMVSPIGWLLLTIGFVLAVVIPYMPLIYFFLAAFSWLVLAIQTIISAPLVLMQMFYPNRQGGIGGTSLARMLVLLLGLLLRPALIIIGLVFCMAAMRVGMDFLNVLTRNALSVLTYSGSGGFGLSVSTLAMAVGGFFIYVSMAFVLVSTCCSLIDGVAEFVMDMVENGMGRLVASEARQRTEGALGNPGAAVATGALLSARGHLAGTASRQIGSNARQMWQNRKGGGGQPKIGKG